LQAGALCAARSLPISAHTSPSVHMHVCCAVEKAVHVEYFHDHVRIEHMLFDGVVNPKDGQLHPDLSREGLGLELREADAARYRVSI
jgi:L-alanine-DL-glutamate epimerase-like enolase superfamily enzyme